MDAQHRIASGLVVAVGLCVFLVIGCGDGGDKAGTGGFELVETLRIGQSDGADEYLFGQIADIAMGPEGDVYVADRQLVQVRQYDATGAFVRNIGREGEGPGEYPRILGLEVTPDGTIAVLTSPHRIILYTPDGEYASDHRVPSGFHGPGMFESDIHGNYYVKAIATPQPPMEGEWPFVLLMVSRGGEVVARIPVPKEDAGGKGGVLYTSEGPRYFFVTSNRHAWSPLGYFVTGRNDAYAIELRDTTGIVGRFEHEWEPVALTDGEKKQWEAWTDMMWKDPAPDRPSIPDVKPVFRDIRVGDEGWIWVNRHTLAVKRDLPPREEGDERPQLEWWERQTHDVFTPDGTFVGAVEVPEDVYIAVSRGRILWGVHRTDNGEQVVRLEMRERASEQAATRSD